MGAFAFKFVRSSAICAAVLWTAQGYAQSLESYDAQIAVAAGGYRVSIQMLFRDVTAVRYSMLESAAGPLTEVVSACDGTNETVHAASWSGRQFPAAQTRLSNNCEIVRLSYEVPAGSRVPLLIPDIKLAAGGRANLEVNGETLRGRDLFPRLIWSADGTGRRQMRHVPAVLILDVPETAGASRDAPGFGWRFYGFFICAAVFLGGFFLWVRLSRQ